MRKPFIQIKGGVQDIMKKTFDILKQNGITQTFVENGDLAYVPPPSASEEIVQACCIANALLRGENVLPSPWVDVDGNQNIAVEGHENAYHYNVAPAIDMPAPQHQLANTTIISALAPVIPQQSSQTRNLSTVYNAKSPDNRSFIKAKHGSSNIADDIIGNFFICSENDILYSYSFERGYYVKMDGLKMHHLIDAFCRSKEVHADPSMIDEIVRSLRYDSRIEVRNNRLMMSPDTWPFLNGVFNISTGEFMGPGWKYFHTEVVNANYRPEAQCPVFDAFIAVCMGNEPALVELCWQLIGYILSSDMNAKVFFEFKGPKDTGKSLMGHVIMSLLNEEAVGVMDLHDLDSRFALSELDGKRLSVCMDSSNSEVKANAVVKVKSITGGDKVRIEQKYKQGRTTKIDAKFLFITNFGLKLETSDPAFKQRRISVPFLCQVPKEKQNHFLLDEILKELDGIAYKASLAYLRLVKNYYIFPQYQEVFPSVDEIDHIAVISEFSKVCCDFSDPSAKTSTEELHEAYVRFCENRGLEALGKSLFSGEFNAMHPSVTKKKDVYGEKSLQGYVGVKLKLV